MTQWIFVSVSVAALLIWVALLGDYMWFTRYRCRALTSVTYLGVLFVSGCVLLETAMGHVTGPIPPGATTVSAVAAVRLIFLE